ncbi:MAG: beta-N-acetylhexosaminidase, partial [Moraxellaceae bacterium]
MKISIKNFFGAGFIAGFSLIGAAAVSLTALAQAPAGKGLTQQQLTDFAGKAEFRIGVVSNYTPEADGLKGHITLNNTSSVALPAGESSWRIYFHSVRGISAAETAGLRMTHVQGDLHELAPTKAFAGLAAGATVDFPFHSGEWMVSYTDFMPRAFIAQGTNAVVFANTDTEQLTKFVDPITRPEQQLRFGIGKKDLYPVATAASRYQNNLAANQIKVSSTDVAQRIIPAPKTIKVRKGSAIVDNSWRIQYAGRLTQEAGYLQKQLKAAGLDIAIQSNDNPATDKVIILDVTGKGVAESYDLAIDADKITINGGDNAGAFYGLQSLLRLLPVERAGSFELPHLTISDAPRFSWRGMHYDMGRNFHGKEVTLRLIEQMAFYKLNKLHLHLTEDEGWRLQIPGLPELTDIGGARCFDLSEQSCLLTQLGTGPSKSGSGNGYYTTADFIEILKFATARHIEVIPEIDMPGHARAAVKSMQARHKRLLAAGQKEAADQYLLSDPLDKSKYRTVQSYTDNSINVCLPSTYAFVDKVDVAEL